MEKGVEGVVLWKGEPTSIRCLGSHKTVAQNARTVIWLVRLEILPDKWALAAAGKEEGIGNKKEAR